MNKITQFIILTFAIFIFNSCSQNTQIANLSPLEFQAAFQKDAANAILLDVRTPQEFSVSRIDGAVNMDVNDPNFEKQIETLDKNKIIYVYCLSGSRSKEAGNILAKKGFTVKELNQGILGWRNSGLPTINTDPATGEKRLSVSEKFYEEIKGSKLVMVDFYADWCRPCKMMEPDVNRIKQERASDVTVLKINTDNETALAEKYKISSIPTLIMFKNNELLYEQAGLHTYDQINDLINKYK
ncbi:MAG: thioredoxin [Bacteroidia bacterium]|jgi:thioredoxin|nr:thioredoxin [Bacteroidia bacterium]MCO5252952.1 thioredoxin [Bacteroidota bacterium]MCZ2131225.1 thioredoxin [Bacteroidia bacterium]